ncbi:MAG: carbamate kinase [Actinomycetota bacterium]|nr:carbamate kinase [Actinomycetota bacterium]MDH4352709.1 carbamate kinase [Actinomycetota bacterium]MDH5278787.1 carbamate kinase [Actinomycetota bacterium]
MRVVVALGGNALLRRGQPMTAENQRANVRVAAVALAPIAVEHELVVTHGNGPQVGLLALQAAASHPDEVFPLDVLGAETEGMIGYLIEQELGNLLPFEKPLATILTMTEVDPDDPAFADPTKFVGPVYDEASAHALGAQKGWVFKPDGSDWRRVVPSPQPRRIFELRPVRWLLEQGAVVIAAGGGGIPTMYVPGTRTLVGVEAVVDKDLASAVLAEQIEADLFVVATEVDAVYLDWGTPQQRAIRQATPEALAQLQFPAGSMGPKVEAAAAFVRATGKRSLVGALDQITELVAGEVGTAVEPDVPGGMRTD